MRYPEKINKILPRIMKSLNLEERLKEINAIKRWNEIVGDRVARHAKATNINELNLYVIVDNPLWQAQLFLLKNKILQKFNELGVNLKDVKFIIGKGGFFKE